MVVYVAVADTASGLVYFGSSATQWNRRADRNVSSRPVSRLTTS